MAEFLIFNKINYLDLPSKSNPGMTGYEYAHFKIDTNIAYTINQKIKSKDVLTKKYMVRFQPGDPNGEVHEDGFWTDGTRKGFGAKKGLALVCIPGMKVKDIKLYLRSLEDKTDPNKPVLLKRSQYQVDLTKVILENDKLIVTKLADLHLKDKAIQIG